MTGYFLPPDHPKMYQAIGLLRGQYLPGAENFNRGFFLTSDGTRFPAIVSGHTASRLQNHPEWINDHSCWSAWPRMPKNSTELFLRLITIKRGKDEADRALIEANIDYFSIRGVVVFHDSTAGSIAIRIQRNEKAPEGKERMFSWQSFNLQIEGFLPGVAVGQFWELQCRRDRDRLVLEDANLVEEAPLQKKKDISISPHDASASPKKAGKTQVHQRSDEDMAVSGRLELTIKINEFPTDIRTDKNGWKEFEVDCDGQVVSVTVKPKVFKKLEQANESYPMWVAAIAGKMGQRTANGFVLLEPKIQVFERKPNEPKPIEPSTQPVAK